MRRIPIVLLTLLAAGCSGYSLEELRHTEPSGAEFNQLLTRHYLDYAEEEARAYDWSSSARFADKGLLAAYDNEVGPEEVSAYDIPADMIDNFTQARVRLLAQLTDKNRAERAGVAADALFYFDCWIERQEEGWKEEAIAYCRDHLKDRLDELEDTSYVKALKDMGEAGPTIDTTSYVVFFDWGQSIITEAGSTIIDEVVRTLEPKETYEIILNGHTDTVGSDKYNLQLSQRRADAVKKRLVEGGVKAEAIKIFAYGESDPAVKTKDGVAEKANRRVEIFLGD